MYAADTHLSKTTNLNDNGILSSMYGINYKNPLDKMWEKQVDAVPKGAVEEKTYKINQVENIVLLGLLETKERFKKQLSVKI